MRKAWALLQRSHPHRPRASGVRHPHRPRASWCSAGLAGNRLIPARMADGCTSRAPPWCRPEGFLRGSATTDSDQAQGRDQGSRWCCSSWHSRSSFGGTTQTAVGSTQTLCCAIGRRLFCKTTKSRGPWIKLSPRSKRLEKWTQRGSGRNLQIEWKSFGWTSPDISH